MKILGIGNALVDMLIRLDNESMLAEFGLAKGSMQLIDKVTKNKIISHLKDYPKEFASGGSASNTIHGLARLGLETAYIGKINNDELGEIFKNDLIKSGITPVLKSGINESGLAITFITKDSERTFGTFLGAAIELSASDLDKSLFHGYDLLHIEGYLVQNHDLIETALVYAKENGLQTSLDLASFNVVEDNLEFLQYIVKKYVDIIFANEEEAKAFTGKEPEEALNILANECDIAIVKLGAKGSLIKSGSEIVEVGVIKANSIDTTGAGDLYASGFIFGLSKGKSFEECGKTGALLSGKVIENTGAKLTDNQWNEIDQLIARF